MMTSFVCGRVAFEFFGETTLQTKPYFRRGERRVAGMILIRKRQQS